MRLRMKRPSSKRLLSILVLITVMIVGSYQSYQSRDNFNDDSTRNLPQVSASEAGDALSQLQIKGRAPKTGFSRDLFSSAWAEIDGCDMRNFILQRDLDEIILDNDNCTVISGRLDDPYTKKIIDFRRGRDTSSHVQIDHVVALSDAWQKGAQNIDDISRYQFYNDPQNLLAVDGGSNQQKGDSDAASWLPQNKDFRCQYVSQQINIKSKYNLWVTRSEYDAMAKILKTCPGQTLPATD